MARTHIIIYYVISALFIFIIDASPCFSSVCSESAILDCRSDNLENDCPYYRKQMQCLNQIDESTCPDGQTRALLKETLENTNTWANKCPGLPDGVCHFNAIQDCGVRIAYQIFKKQDNKKDVKDKCAQFKGTEDTKKQCINDVMSKCVDNAILRTLGTELEWVDTARSICSTY